MQVACGHCVQGYPFDANPLNKGEACLLVTCHLWAQILQNFYAGTLPFQNLQSFSCIEVSFLGLKSIYVHLAPMTARIARATDRRACTGIYAPPARVCA